MLFSLGRQVKTELLNVLCTGEKRHATNAMFESKGVRNHLTCWTQSLQQLLLLTCIQATSERCTT